MSKPLIIIADTDELYLQNLERKFLEEFDDQIELEIISDPVYFEQRFETPVSVEILAVSEALYSAGLQRHNISNLCVLAEEHESGSTEDLSVNRVYKYLGIRELFNELTYQSRDRLTESQTQEHKTQIISFYSAIGGTGKTALSVGLARCLSEKHKRVFYVNTESVQDFSYYLENKTGMPNEGYRVMKNEQEHMYQNVRFTLRKEGFTYLPPFKSTLDARNLDFTIYRKLIQSAKDSGDYDFIIVNVKIAELDGRKQELLARIAELTVEAISPEQVSQISGYLDTWENVSFDDKRRVVDLMITTIAATSDSLNITWKI